MCKIPSSFIFIFYSILFKNVFYMMKMYKFKGSEKGLRIPGCCMGNLLNVNAM